VDESRRRRYDAHGEERGRQVRCVLCQQWIDADHEEALALERAEEKGKDEDPTRPETGFALGR
jgi:hypothetical protein